MILYPEEIEFLVVLLKLLIEQSQMILFEHSATSLRAHLYKEIFFMNDFNRKPKRSLKFQYRIYLI